MRKRSKHATIPLMQIDPRNPYLFVNAARVTTVEATRDGMVIVNIAGAEVPERIWGDIGDVVARLTGVERELCAESDV